MIRPGSTNQEVDQEAVAVLRKMVEIERSYAVTKEIAQFKTLLLVISGLLTEQSLQIFTVI